MFDMTGKKLLYIVYRMEKGVYTWYPTFEGSYDDCKYFLGVINCGFDLKYYYKLEKTNRRILNPSSLSLRRRISFWFDNHLVR